MEKDKITPFYEHDHDELDGYFQEFRNLKNKNYSLAVKCFEKFQTGLLRHIVWEEDILFPLFEEKTGMKDHGPTFVMREEHRQIKEYLRGLDTKIEQKAPDTDSQEQLLLELLSAHNQKEENILYPAVDQITSREERERVFERMKNLSRNVGLPASNN